MASRNVTLIASGYSTPNSSDLPDLSYLSGVFFTLLIAGGNVGLPLLVILLKASKRLRRPHSVPNLLVTWILFSVSYCLL